MGKSIVLRAEGGARAAEVHVPAVLDLDTLATFEAALAEVSPCAALVLVGGGHDEFCHGLDFAGLLALPAHELERAVHAFARCLMRLRRMPVPTIAVVDGEVRSGGVGLAAACDVVLATPTARFALQEAALGLRHAMIRPIVEERVRPARLRQIILRGSSLVAFAAVDIGLADRVVAQTSLQRVVREEVRALGKAKPALIGAVKSTPGLAAEIAAGAEETLRRLADPAVQRALA